MRSNCSSEPGGVDAGGEAVDRRRRVGLGEGDGGLDLGLGFGLHRVEALGGDAARFEQLAGPRQRILVAVRLDLVLGAVGEPGVGDRVAAVAVGDRLEHRRAALLAGLVQQSRGGRLDLLEVVAVDPLALHPVGAGALEEVGLGGGAVDARPHPVEVVDHQEDDRQVPDRGQVQRLVPGAHVDGAVAELTEDRLLGAAADQRERHPGRDRHLAADDPQPP